MSEKVVLKFALSAEDFRKVQQFRHSKESKNSFLNFSPKDALPLTIIGLLVFVVSIVRGSSIPNSAIFALASVLASGIAGALILLVIGQPLQLLARFLGEKVMYRNAKRTLTEGRDETQYEFDENGIRTIYREEESFGDWKYVTEVDEYAEGYLFLSKDKQIELVIPKRAFLNALIEDRFRNLIRGKLGFKARLQLLK